MRLTVSEMYKGSFFSRRCRLSWRVPYVCDAICKVLDPGSVVDIGCGIGDYLKGFMERGLTVTGIEGSKNCLPYLVVPEEEIWILDIREPINLPWHDLALCLEVLEHVEEEFADILVQNLTELSRKLLVSAAPPGQGGHYHVNCQPKEYWINIFWKYGYLYNQGIVDLVRKEWEPVRCKKEMSAYYNNLMCFVRRDDDKILYNII